MYMSWENWEHRDMEAWFQWSKFELSFCMLTGSEGLGCLALAKEDENKCKKNYTISDGHKCYNVHR